MAATISRQFGREDGTANVLAAAKKAGASDAERRMLHSLFRWRDGRRLQAGVFQRIARVMARLDPAAAKELRELFWTTEGERALAATLMSDDWIEPASSLDVALLLRSPAARPESLPRELRTFLKERHQQVPAIEEDPAIAKQLAGFRGWAAKHGHSRWVVQGCLRRALGPLLAHAFTKGLMPGWGDLTPDQRREFVKVSLDRERLILGTQPAHLRAMERFPSPAALRQRDAQRKADVPPAASMPSRMRCEECTRLYRVPKGHPPACPHCRAIPRFAS